MGSHPSKNFTSVVPPAGSLSSTPASSTLDDDSCQSSTSTNASRTDLPFDFPHIRRNIRKKLSTKQSSTFSLDSLDLEINAEEYIGRSSLPCIRLEAIESSHKPKTVGRRVRKSSLPPLTTSGLRKRRQLPPIQVPDFDEGKTLPFKEYKKWLSNFKSSGAEMRKGLTPIDITPVKPFDKNRCQTAVLGKLRGRTSGDEKIPKPSSPHPRIFTICDSNNSIISKKNQHNKEPKIFSSGHHALPPLRRKSHPEEGIFDLQALNDALTKPRNKVVPVSQLSVHHLKPSLDF
jgi:hypothetical protein